MAERRPPCPACGHPTPCACCVDHRGRPADPAGHYDPVRDPQRDKQAPAHRVAWEREHGPVPDGLIVMHLCDVRPCCFVPHLSVGTYRDNSRDMARKGRAIRPTWRRPWLEAHREETTVGMGEVCRIVGLSRQRVHQLIKAGDFPDPIDVLANNRRVWNRYEVVLWARVRE